MVPVVKEFSLLRGGDRCPCLEAIQLRRVVHQDARLKFVRKDADLYKCCHICPQGYVWVGSGPVDAVDVAGELQRAEEGTVEAGRDGIFDNALDADCFSENFGVVLRLITEERDAVIVPATAPVVGDPVGHDVVVVAMVDATPHQLRHLAVTDP
jgi:hypothetical protein